MQRTDYKGFQEIIALQQQGKLDLADAACRRLLILEPKSAKALHLLGLLECQRGFTVQGLETLKQSLALEPKNAEFHNNMAGMLGQLGRHEEAVQCSKRAIELSPNFGLAHFNLGLNLEKIREFGAAADEYRIAMNLMPQHPESKYRLGCMLHQMGQYRESEEIHFDLFGVSSPPAHDPANHLPLANPKVVVVITCKGRLAHLRQTLPRVLNFPYPDDYRVVVVDYGDPDGTFDWCRQLRDRRLISLKILDDVDLFNKARAFNCGANSIASDLLCFVDADSILDPQFLHIAPHPIVEGRAVLTRRETDSNSFDTVGVCCVRTSVFRAISGYDEELRGYGPEDIDFFARARQLGKLLNFPAWLYPHSIKHSNSERTRYYAAKNIRTSKMQIVRRLLDANRAINSKGYGRARCEWAAHETDFASRPAYVREPNHV